MNEEKRFRSIDMKLFIGMAVLVAGGFLLMQNMDMSPLAEHVEFWKLWPLVLIFLGLGQLIQPRESRNVCTGLIVFSIGGYFMLTNLELIDMAFTRMWPVALIIIGVLFLYRAFVPSKGSCFSGSCGDSDRGNGFGDGRNKVFADNKGNIDSDFIDMSLALSSSVHRVTSKSLTGGRLNAVMGNIELDLWDADFKGNSLTMEAAGVMSNIELSVPRDWEVTVHGSPMLGSIENKTVPPVAARKKLVVKGSAVMGVVLVKN